MDGHSARLGRHMATTERSRSSAWRSDGQNECERQGAPERTEGERRATSDKAHFCNAQDAQLASVVVRFRENSLDTAKPKGFAKLVDGRLRIVVRDEVLFAAQGCHRLRQGKDIRVEIS